MQSYLVHAQTNFPAVKELTILQQDKYNLLWLAYTKLEIDN